ncbi:AraC family transcriptional regulator [Heyndrickxia sporothermodurans]|nr:AraC family transcriptional regulator [Heyndrickxia sporothermodurans]
MESYDTSIFKVIQYLESRMNQEVTLEELSSKAAFSKYHFTRIFKALTKETVYEYVRKRRLTLAAKELIESDTPLIQLAFKFGYASQEAFSRAFKSYMGTSPLSYRKKGAHYNNLYKEVLSEEILQTRKRPIRYATSIIEMSGFCIGGIPLAMNVNNHTISKHWNKFYDELIKYSIDPNTTKCFGYESLDEDNKPLYIAAIEVDSLEDLPNSCWVGKYIPPHKYAAVPLDNVIENIPFAIEEIYKNELPALNVKPALNFSLEFYPEHFKANEPTYLLQYLIPIK